MNRARVSTYCNNVIRYCSEAPYHPGKQFPEFDSITGFCYATTENPVYHAVRRSLMLLGLDKDNYGTPKWNPLGKFVRPGCKVVIKPNLVMHHRNGVKERDCITTHGSVIRAIIDYVFLALGGHGDISIADTPLQSADFEKIVRETGLDEIQGFYDKTFGMKISILDLRNEWALTDGESAYILEKRRLPGDPNGSYEIDLGMQSELLKITKETTRFSVHDYKDSFICTKHAPDTHKYLFSGTVLSADFVVNVPKLKTHQKAGITCALKNSIGMNVSKDYIPHFRLGPPDMDGDEYPCRSIYNSVISKYRKAFQNRIPIGLWKLARRGAFAFQNNILGMLCARNDDISYAVHGGAWHGNDTIWRAILDLNRILLYADKDGIMRDKIQRKCLTIVDGITAGEGEGPLKASAKHCGLIACGEDPVAVDVICARLMGFDESKIPLLSNSYGTRHYPITSYGGALSSIKWVRNKSLDSFLAQKQSFKFKPPMGWVGRIERNGLSNQAK